jgi:serine/threonine-protein kinase HipA
VDATDDVDATVLCPQKAPSVSSAIIDDGLGEFHVNVSSIRQRFLESFRLRTEHAAAIHENMRDALADRLIAEYGDREQAADAVYELARAPFTPSGGLA